jgi:arabinogalactan oligomer / maltooligosaccharide transport system substrate-binding protein
MFRKLYLVLSLLIAASMLLAACGGGAATPAPEHPAATSAQVATESPAATSAPAATQMPAASAPVATLVLWVDAVKAPVFSKISADFLAKYNVKIDIQITNFGDILTKFQTAAPAGNGPDIIVVPHDQAATLVANGLVAPIDLGDKKSSFLQRALDAFTYDGKLYAMPYVVENNGLFYNKKLVTDLPKTWEDLMATGKALQDAKKATYCLGFGSNNYHLYPVFTSYGGYIFGKDAKGNYNPADLGIDNAGFIKASQFLQDSVKSGCLSANVDGSVALKLFTDGQLPFYISGPWDLPALAASGVSYGITGFPSNGSPFAGVQGFLVNSKSPNVLLAQTFLTDYIATDDVMTQIQNAELKASAFKPVFDKITNPDILALGLAGNNSVPMPAIPAMGSVWGAWSDAMTLIFQGKQTADAALKDAGKKIRDVIANPLTGMVNVPGDWQDQIAGCGGQWKPDCKDTAMTKSADGKSYTAGPFKLKKGDYLVKAALDGAWTTSYGVDGKAGGDNIKFSLPADGTVSFSWDTTSHILTITVK